MARHCAACGEKVESYEVDLGGITEVRCLRCGLPLERSRADGARPRFRRVLVADDSRFFTEALREFLRQGNFTREVVVAADGAQALEAVATALRNGSPFSLAILDLLMPRLNGFHAAVGVRAVERAFAARRADLLFLSSRRIDDSLKPLLEELSPAFYLNKGARGGEVLGPRLEEVLSAIAGTSRRAGIG